MRTKVTVAGTGHRPDKLRVPDPYSRPVLFKVKDIAKDYLIHISDELEAEIEVISGMALCWDMAVALAAIELEFPLTAAIPFKGQESRWNPEDKALYFEILRQCQDIVYVCEPGYANWKMQKRNEWMTVRADIMLALWDGSKGGTGNCIQYAKKKNKQIINAWDSWLASRQKVNCP